MEGPTRGSGRRREAPPSSAVPLRSGRLLLRFSAAFTRRPFYLAFDSVKIP
ncbi:hypothetical protein SAMN05444745_1243 [Arthrobacter sp. OV608]|nr:hypothetical protein SAMN05444745_1243 [Arthrobacter sp. OV608]